MEYIFGTYESIQLEEMKKVRLMNRIDTKYVTTLPFYKFNKKHSVSLFYRYIDKADDDEASGNVIGIGYKFKL